MNQKYKYGKKGKVKTDIRHYQSTYTRGVITLTIGGLQEIVSGLSWFAARDRLERWISTKDYSYEHLTRQRELIGLAGQCNADWSK